LFRNPLNGPPPQIGFESQKARNERQQAKLVAWESWRKAPDVRRRRVAHN